MGARILVVEDNRGMRDVVTEGLAEEGYATRAADTGRGALRELRDGATDAIVLDLGLPDIDGIEVIEAVRATSEVPVLVLTARDALASRVAALDAGADDYLVKPFEFAELLARLRALLRRAAAPGWAPLELGGLRLDPAQGATFGDRTIRLSPRERGILELLLRRQEQAVTRAEIHREVFGYDFDPGTNTIDVHVSHLRRKLADCDVRIETVRGVGYRLAAGAE